MKKIVLLFLTLFTLNIYAISAISDTIKTRVNKIGQKVVTENKLPKEVSFNVVESDTVNAYADANNQIVIYTGLLNLAQKDEEIAGIMSHEIGHIMKSHCYKQTFFNIALGKFYFNIMLSFAICALA